MFADKILSRDIEKALKKVVCDDFVLFIQMIFSIRKNKQKQQNERDGSGRRKSVLFICAFCAKVLYKKT
jgi:hypothetical protein